MTVHCSRSRTTPAPAARCRVRVTVRSTVAMSACARTRPVGSPSRWNRMRSGMPAGRRRKESSGSAEAAHSHPVRSCQKVASPAYPCSGMSRQTWSTRSGTPSRTWSRSPCHVVRQNVNPPGDRRTTTVSPIVPTRAAPRSSARAAADVTSSTSRSRWSRLGPSASACSLIQLSPPGGSRVANSSCSPRVGERRQPVTSDQKRQDRPASRRGVSKNSQVQRISDTAQPPGRRRHGARPYQPRRRRGRPQ